jgi:hypothetical protein
MFRVVGPGANPDNGNLTPQVPRAVLNHATNASTGMSHDYAANMLGGKPFFQKPVSAYEQYNTHKNINDLFLTQLSNDIMQIIMTTMGANASAFTTALPPVRMDGDSMELNRVIFMNDAPAPRAPEAPNPQLTSRTERMQVKILQHGVSIPTESMAFTTPEGQRFFAAQLSQAAEAFNQYFVGIQADELLRAHELINTSGSRIRASNIFDTEDALCAHLQDMSAKVNIWHKHADPLSAVSAAINRAIVDQNGTHNMLIVPQRSVDIQRAMAANAMLNKSTERAGIKIPRLYESVNIPQRGCDALSMQAQFGHFAFSEYSPLSINQRSIRVHNESTDGFTELHLMDGLIFSGLFNIADNSVQSLTPMGEALFGNGTWEEFFKRYDVLRDIEEFLRKAGENTTNKFLELIRGDLGIEDGGGAEDEQDGREERVGVMGRPFVQDASGRVDRDAVMQKAPEGYEEMFAVVKQSLRDAFQDKAQSRFLQLIFVPVAKGVLKSFEAYCLALSNVVNLDSGVLTNSLGKIIAMLRDLYDATDDDDKGAVVTSTAVQLRRAPFYSGIENERSIYSVSDSEDPGQYILDASELLQAADAANNAGQPDALTIDSVFKIPVSILPGMLMHLAEIGAPVPVSIIWFRPHMNFTADATIGCQSGGGTGNSFYGPGSIEFGGNVTLQNKELTANAFFGALVTNPNNLVVFPCSRITHYNGGGGCRLVDMRTDAAAIRDSGSLGDADIIPVVAPPGWYPQREIMDITGQFHPSLVRGTNGVRHYPLADMIAATLGLQHASVEDIRMGRVNSSNTLCWRMTQLPKTKAQEELGVDQHEGTGPLGAFYPGAAQQRRGLGGPLVEAQNGKRQTITPYQAL